MAKVPASINTHSLPPTRRFGASGTGGSWVNNCPTIISTQKEKAKQLTHCFPHEPDN
jgi:hypothetical protein